MAAIVVELVVTEGSGQYFQGRYLGPLFVGVPILLAGRIDGLPTINVARLWRYALPVWLVMVNCHLLFAARRWGVGVNGSWYPGDWTIRISLASIPLILVTHVTGSFFLANFIRARRNTNFSLR